MKILLRVVAVLFVLIAALLLYAIVAAVTSDAGARTGVAIAYFIGAIVLGFLASKMWSYRS